MLLVGIEIEQWHEMGLIILIVTEAEAAVRRCSVKKGVLKSYANFIGKQLCWSLF